MFDSSPMVTTAQYFDDSGNPERINLRCSANGGLTGSVYISYTAPEKPSMWLVGTESVLRPAGFNVNDLVLFSVTNNFEVQVRYCFHHMCACACHCYVSVSSDASAHRQDV